ncbi:hypothetical protein OGAPHI_002035 [Ogataea philodendri]|uniref:Uncharacterized protein n=1 Tax=Ogataea philodendri TaxID=1378263 RepID=A0A9P8T6X9_9ASCO|nr:uncharacterized protein OGAPHI_002035 [Ogataea philodendri]KAH3668281.1 hypothetical protein OGAPHI_002035 [Ogataea philodendri]
MFKFRAPFRWPFNCGFTSCGIRHDITISEVSCGVRTPEYDSSGEYTCWIVYDHRSGYDELIWVMTLLLILLYMVFQNCMPRACSDSNAANELVGGLLGSCEALNAFGVVSFRIIRELIALGSPLNADVFKMLSLNFSESLKLGSSSYGHQLLSPDTQSMEVLTLSNDRQNLARVDVLGNVLNNKLLHGLHGLDGVGAHVWQRNHIWLLHKLHVDVWLVFKHICTKRANLAAFQGRKQGALVDNGSSGRVDDNHPVLHLRNGVLVDRVLGGTVEWDVNRNDVRLFQQLVKRNVLSTAFQLSSKSVSVVIDDLLEPKRFGSVSHSTANSAHSVDTKHLSFGIVANWRACTLAGWPFTFQQVQGGELEVSQCSQQQVDMRVGCCCVHKRRNIGNLDSQFAALNSVHLVVSRTVVRNCFQLSGLLQQTQQLLVDQTSLLDTLKRSGNDVNVLELAGLQLLHKFVSRRS